MESIKWRVMKDLSNVQVGDLLIKEFRGGANVVKVIRVTSTQVIVTHEQKYYKKNGHKVGGSGGFYFDSIHIPSDGEVESVIKNNTIINVCRKAIERLGYYNISYEQAVQIKEILNL